MKVPAWMAALPLNRDEEWVDVLDFKRPRPSFEYNGRTYEDFETRRVQRLTPVRIVHRTPYDGLAAVEFQ